MAAPNGKAGQFELRPSKRWHAVDCAGAAKGDVLAVAQVAGIMGYLASDDETRSKVSYFMAIDSAKFRKPVMPGDQLRIEVETIFNRRGIWSVAGKAYVDGVLATEAELKATFAEKVK